MNMRDADVRQALKDRLEQAQVTKGGLLVDELGLCNGAVRADLAVVNGILKGYEIKSDHDTLVRLKGQADIYSQVFDTVTLVVAKRHLPTALTLIPEWWGVEVAIRNERSEEVTLDSFRPEQINQEVNPCKLVQLLWREEAVLILQQKYTAKSFAGKTRSFLWEHLVSSLTLPDLKDAVRNTLKSRTNWRVDELQTPDDVTFPPSATLLSCQGHQSHQRSRKYIYRPN
jgi:hypothetical protein